MSELISRQAAIKAIDDLPNCYNGYSDTYDKAYIIGVLEEVPPQKPRLCKDCKFFEYDHVENVYGIPLIVAHEICNKWGDGCRTSEDGYCFLFKPKEGESE